MFPILWGLLQSIVFTVFSNAGGVLLSKIMGYLPWKSSRPNKSWLAFRMIPFHPGFPILPMGNSFGRLGFPGQIIWCRILSINSLLGFLISGLKKSPQKLAFCAHGRGDKGIDGIDIQNQQQHIEKPFPKKGPNQKKTNLEPQTVNHLKMIGYQFGWWFQIFT